MDLKEMWVAKSKSTCKMSKESPILVIMNRRKELNGFNERMIEITNIYDGATSGLCWQISEVHLKKFYEFKEKIDFSKLKRVYY